MVSCSSTKTKFKALANAMYKLIWVQTVLAKLKIAFHEVLIVYCDNVDESYITKHLAFHAKIKHLEIDFYFIREKILAGILQVKYVPSQEQIAYIMNKTLASSSFSQLRTKPNDLPRPLAYLKMSDTMYVCMF